ncbi:MAG: hypothetical protein IT499_05785, partial [Rubrivivax sp.]|nr:hypothetical protein [Rubrivivax sp.]
MHVEGVPPLDAALVPALRRYAEVTGHGIADWHPTAREMLVVHRARGLALVASVPLDRGARGGSPAARTALTTRLTLVYPLAPEAPGGRRVVAELPGAGWFGGDVSPDETRLALTRYYSATHSEVWLLELPRVTADTTPPTTATPRRLLPAAGETLRAAHFVEGFTPDGRDELRLIDLSTHTERPLPAALPTGGVSAIRLHPGSGEIAFVTQSAQGPGQVHSLDPKTGRVEAWTRVAAPADLDLAQLPAQQIARWKTFDGRTISGVLSLPPARFTGKRPVLLWMHGGPEGQSKLGWNG